MCAHSHTPSRMNRAIFTSSESTAHSAHVSSSIKSSGRRALTVGDGAAEVTKNRVCVILRTLKAVLTAQKKVGSSPTYRECVDG